MNNFLIRLSLSAITLICLAVIGIGQVNDRDAASAASGSLYVVSAKAGGTNFVQGGVTIQRAEGKSGLLLVGDFVEVGDKIAADNTGRAEILLNPGSFLRIDKNTGFEFLSTSLENLSVSISRGTAIFEVFASEDFKVKVVSGDSTFLLVKTGIYRVDVDSSGQARLEVWKGKAQAGNQAAKTVKKGRSAVVDGNSVAVSKFNKSKDNFEEWSESRAKLIAKANERLVARDLGRRVLSSFQNYGWNCYDSFGLWVLDRRLGSYSFLPFGNRWRSPYGHRLRTNTSTCDYPEEYWRQPLGYIHPPMGGGNGGSGTPTVVPQANIDRANRNQTPPFQRIEQSGSVRRTSPNSFPTSGDFPASSSSPARRSAPADSGNQTTKTPSSSPPKESSDPPSPKRKGGN